jgi:hypothetical protein
MGVSMFVMSSSISLSTWRFRVVTWIEGGRFHSGGSDLGCTVPRRCLDADPVCIDLLDIVWARVSILDADLLCPVTTAPEDLRGSPTNAASTTF